MTTFVSTAIPYVNARPHVGFAYELVLADVLARHARRRGRRVHFATGTDDNSLKNVRAAAAAGVPTQDFVDGNAEAFRALGPLLDVAPDDFVRTSRDPRHRATVDRLWRACEGELYRRAWRGLYCVGCEAFVDGPCDEHAAPPEAVEEDNWFFRLSRFAPAVRDAIVSGKLAIVPESARAEALAFLDGEVRDLSVSREAARAGGWGIPVPGDPSQVIYVWFDALANYVASIGEDAWRGADASHVIGKGISRFHAVYWPAFLLAAGLPLPKRILVHGYLTVDGVKIAKSGAGFEVGPLVERTGADALRWYFARCCRTRSDADVSLAAIGAAHDRDLVDRLGNLVHRCAVLAGKLGDGCVPARADGELCAIAEALPARVDAALDAFLLDDAVAAVISLVDAANRALDRDAPWRTRDATALYAPLEAARIAAGELAPFVPGVARAIATALGGATLDPAWGGLAEGTRLRTDAPPLRRVVSATSG